MMMTVNFDQGLAGKDNDERVNGDRRYLVAGLIASSAALFVSPVHQLGASAGAPFLRSTDFPSLAAAVGQWARAGGTLVIAADHAVPMPITMNCLPGRSYRLTTDGPRTLAYVGPHTHWFFCILAAGGNPLAIDGDLTVDGQNNCNIPFFARFENVLGGARRDCSIEGLTVRNARMKKGRSRIDGSPLNAYGATGALFSGGFDRLHLRNVKAHHVTREAGAGRKGSQGCVGISVSGGARHVTVEDFEIVNVDSDDRPGSPARSELDGLLVFQAAEAGGTRPIIRRGVIREAAGRAVKVFAPGGAGITRDLVVTRSVHGVTGGSNDIAHQHGDGLIENIVINYAGNAHSQPTIPVGMSSGSARDAGFPFGVGVMRNIRINDTTGAVKGSVASIYYNVRDMAPRRYALQDITDTGLAEHLFIPGALGAFGTATVDIERVSVSLTKGLFASEDRAPRLQIVARELINRGSRTIPLQVLYNGQPAPRGQGAKLVPEGRLVGISL